jgi:predicted amidohydrolase
MKIYCCQLDIVWEEKHRNFDRVRGLLQAAPPAAGSLLVLPEMFATGFSMRVSHIREGSDSETISFLQEIAREYRVTVLGGLVTELAGRGRNEAVAVSPEGEVRARYTKIHPFSFGQETQHYSPGKELTIFELNGWLVAPFICYDLRFPEVFRSAARRGAQLFVVIANWPAAREQHWMTLLQARAIENQAYVAGVNRCGRDPQLAYSGRSLIMDPKGVVLADAGNAESIVHAELSLELLQAWRRDFPALQDLHPEFLGV